MTAAAAAAAAERLIRAGESVRGMAVEAQWLAFTGEIRRFKGRLAYSHRHNTAPVIGDQAETINWLRLRTRFHHGRLKPRFNSKISAVT